MWRFIFQKSPGVFRFVRRLRGQGWALRSTLFVTTAIMAIPVLALVVTALLVGLVTFAVLSVVARVLEFTGAWGPRPIRRSDGALDNDIGSQRRNVRVIREDM